jgi:hypothetical protein
MLPQKMEEKFQEPSQRCAETAKEKCMKKYIVLGILAGVAVSYVLLLAKRRGQKGSEFRDFLDSQNTADELFGSAFREVPDKM